jgi:uncharacterized damage-inducible protein DinB
MVKEALLAEYDHEMAITRRLLERLPDDRLAWKPHDKSLSLGGLATHLANLPTWAAAIMDAPSFDLGTAPPSREALSSCSAVLAAFDASGAKARASLDATDAAYGVMWTLARDGREIFSMPRINALRSFVLSHVIHHRGQLSVYLRLNNVPVPAIYGPSADEG